MATVKIPTLRVVYKEVFVMLPLYRATRQWLNQNHYRPEEVLYHFRKGTSISPAEKELRIWWRTENEGKWYQNQGVYKYHIDIDWNVIKMYDVEIMIEGKKKKVQKGELIIKIKPYMDVKDFNKNSPLTQFFDNWIKTRLIKKNVEENKKILYQDAYRLQGMIKKYLELKTFIPDEEAFHEKFDPI